MIRKLWQIIDRLEAINMEGFFDDVAKRIELTKAIKLLKQIIQEIEEDLK